MCDNVSEQVPFLQLDRSNFFKWLFCRGEQPNEILSVDESCATHIYKLVARNWKSEGQKNTRKKEKNSIALCRECRVASNNDSKSKSQDFKTDLMSLQQESKAVHGVDLFLFTLKIEIKYFILLRDKKRRF